ncbi:hypothetical protein EDB84DRAFT_1443485 [Lactarius hengduanensis]|nr:hypothetical protein EDB84DRAFT_1443485 [Lactarius hengduanensis]
MTYVRLSPSASKGSWLAPLLLQVFAVHLRRVTKAPTNFGFPAGALALSTAALERGLTLFKTGVNIRDEKDANNAGRTFDNNPWGTIACQYAQSTCDLSERKWGQVIGAASIYLADRVGAPNVEAQRIPVIPDGRSRIAVSDDEADDEADI